MKSSSARNVLAAFFELEETASGYIARCPDCGVRFAVNVKRDVVTDDYVRLLVEHATNEQITFERDVEIQHWLHGGEAKERPFLKGLESAAVHAERCEYKVLRPALRELQAKCSAMSSEISASPRR